MGSGGKQPLDQLLASGAAHQRCYVRRYKRVEDDRAKVAEEEVRVKELRASSRAGKERLASISEGVLRKWQGTMDGGRIPISQPKMKKRRGCLQKHKGLESSGCSVVSFFSVAPPSSLSSSSHPPCADVTSGARAAASVAMVAMVARNAKLARACLCSSCRHCGSKRMGCKGGCN
jgi:hypothetical protein